MEAMAWNEQRVQEVVAVLKKRGGDSAQVEVKRAGGGLPDTLGKTLCAFANMPEGGTILLGIDERSGFQVTGVDKPADLEAGLVSLARNAIDPVPGILTQTVTVTGKDVVVAEVTGLSVVDKPATYHKKAYLRQSDGDYEMADHELRMVEVAKLHLHEQVTYDEREIPDSSLADLDPDQLKQFLSAVRISSRRLRDLSDEEILRLKRVTTGQGTLRLAGSYALGYYPQGADPALEVTAAVQLPRDGSGARTRNLEKFSGPLPVLLEDSLAWVRANISSDRVYDAQGNLETRYEFPLSAVREAIANALVHRDLGPNTLGVGKGVEIRLTDTALLIISPGGLRGMTVQQLRSVDLSRAAVNQRLYAIVQHLVTSEGSGVIEGEGGGVREMMLALREAELAEPEFVDSGVQFVVKFWRGAPSPPQKPDQSDHGSSDAARTALQQTLLSSLAEGQEWTLARVRQEFSPVSEEKVQQQLSQLEESGEITLTDEGQIRLGTTEEARRVEAAAAKEDRAGVALAPEGLSALGRNVPRLYAVFQQSAGGSRGQSISELQEKSGLSLGQTRYALAPLLQEGLVRMEGGQGSRKTTYRLG